MAWKPGRPALSGLPLAGSGSVTRGDEFHHSVATLSCSTAVKTLVGRRKGRSPPRTGGVLRALPGGQLVRLGGTGVTRAIGFGGTACLDVNFRNCRQQLQDRSEISFDIFLGFL